MEEKGLFAGCCFSRWCLCSFDKLSCILLFNSYFSSTEEESFKWMSHVLPAVDSVHTIGVYCLSLVPPNTLPKTSNGQVCTIETKNQFLKVLTWLRGSTVRTSTRCLLNFLWTIHEGSQDFWEGAGIPWDSMDFLGIPGDFKGFLRTLGGSKRETIKFAQGRHSDSKRSDQRNGQMHLCNDSWIILMEIVPTTLFSKMYF